MRIRKVNSVDVKLYDLTKVKLKTAGNTSVVQFTAGNNKTCTVRNLSKDTYLDVKTGEVRKKKKSESRYQSPKSVRKSINRLMDLIRYNATDPSKCKWLSVTYGDVMTDGKQAFLDAKLFLRKLKRYLAKQIDLTSGQKSFQYITIAEPQGERHGNSWHLHILLIFDDTAPFIANDTISELWSHGITSSHKVFDNGQQVSYDNKGNMTYGPLNGVMTDFTYDCRNRLIRAGETEYEYDAENNRTAKIENGIREDYVLDRESSLVQILKTKYSKKNALGLYTSAGDGTVYVYGAGLISQDSDAVATELNGPNVDQNRIIYSTTTTT